MRTTSPVNGSTRVTGTRSRYPVVRAGLDRAVKTDEHGAMQTHAATAHANGIDLAYETMGDPADPALLLVMGLGAQLVSWDDELCQSLVDRGFFVIRYDNRDVGLSTKVPVDGDLDVAAVLAEALSGQPVEAPYLLADMAADALGLLDELGIERANVVGASMGGMIAQSIAIAAPDRVISLTSIMSTTGDADVGQPKPEILPVLLAPPAADRESYIAQSVDGSRAISSPDHFDEARARDVAARAYDRCYYPRGVGNQLIAIIASPSRSDGLRQLHMPALVIHGTDDPLVTPSGGERTAEVLPGAELMMLDGMGHDLPRPYWSPVIEAITTLAARAATAA
jgi:pimeloyl-ACP methyl ester carboxylesterase